MGLRDRFFHPATARAILSWRLLAGLGAGVVAGLVGLPALGAIAIGVGVYVASVALAMPRPVRTASFDAFTLSEPWRQFVQDADRSRRTLQATVRQVPAGPLRAHLDDIAARLEGGITQCWEIAKRGDAIDEAVNRLDPTRLRSRLETLRLQGGDEPTPDILAAIGSVESQLAAADRLKARSAETADRLRLTRARLDELVARAAEVGVGTSDTDTYAHDVDDLVVDLEALRLAIAETNAASGTPTDEPPRPETWPPS
jgi:hypothetical protein